MRKMLFVLFVIVGLSGCELIPYSTWRAPAEINTHEKIVELVSSIHKEANTGVGSWWTPRTTYTLLKGDCNDISGLMANIMIYNLQYRDVRLVGCISRESGNPHMIVYADGKYYESKNGREIRNFHGVYIFTNFLTSYFCS